MSMSDHDHADPAHMSDHIPVFTRDHVDPIIPSSGSLIASADRSIRITCSPPKLPNNCIDFEDLEKLLTVYQDTMFQNSYIKRYKPIGSSNECIKAIERKRPKLFKYKFIQFCCIHGAANLRDQAGNNKKTRMRSSYYTTLPEFSSFTSDVETYFNKAKTFLERFSPTEVGFEESKILRITEATAFDFFRESWLTYSLVDRLMIPYNNDQVKVMHSLFLESLARRINVQVGKIPKISNKESLTRLVQQDLHYLSDQLP